MLRATLAYGKIVTLVIETVRRVSFPLHRCGPCNYCFPPHLFTSSSTLLLDAGDHIRAGENEYHTGVCLSFSAPCCDAFILGFFRRLALLADVRQTHSPQSVRTYTGR